MDLTKSYRMVLAILKSDNHSKSYGLLKNKVLPRPNILYMYACTYNTCYDVYMYNRMYTVLSDTVVDHS